MVANSQPRNAQEAIAQANRLQRARQIIEEGYTFTQDTLTNMVAICKPGELHAAYTIGEHVDGTTGCDCPDACKGNTCKHEIAWGLLQAERADELAGLEAQCALYDEQEGWLDGVHEPFPKTTTLLFLEALQVRMVADLNKHEAAIRKQKFYEVSGHDCSRFNLNVALRVIGEYIGKELVGRLNLLPADEVEL